jgi:hypothetical protein
MGSERYGTKFKMIEKRRNFSQSVRTVITKISIREEGSRFQKQSSRSEHLVGFRKAFMLAPVAAQTCNHGKVHLRRKTQGTRFHQQVGRTILLALKRQFELVVPDAFIAPERCCNRPLVEMQQQILNTFLIFRLYVSTSRRLL